VRCTPNDRGSEDCVAEGLDEEIDLWIGEGPTGQAYAVLAQQDLAAIGLRARLHPVSFPLLLEQSSRERTAPLIFWGYSMDFPDTAGLIEPLFHSRGATATDATNRTFYRNPRVDRLFDEARVERDPARRTALYRELNAIVAADAPWAFVFSNVKVEAWQPYVRNYRPHPVWDEFYRDVWLDLPRRRAAQRLLRAGASSFAALAPLGGWR
jgi:peptide/nickel transport system substrate-binding protein